VGKKINSVAMFATATDSISDCIATTAVLLCSIIAHFTSLNLDAYCGVVVAIFIFIAGFNAAKDTINPLLGTPPEEEFVDEIEKIVMAHDDILGIHDLIVHNYGPGRVMISLHAEVDAKGDILKIHDLIDNIEQELKTKLKRLYSQAVEIADKLHEKRLSSSIVLEKKVRETLDFLDMPSVVFYTSFKENAQDGEKQLSTFGYDSAEFYVSANKGAEPMPMSKIASGGELARVMLALKSEIADKDGVATVIYDEIDAGVSGKTARKIGVKMFELSKTSQIICVTHSAQIASLADAHMLIRKREVDGKTQTEVYPLDYEGRVSEVSRILGGIDITKSQREAAIDMLREKELLS